MIIQTINLTKRYGKLVALNNLHVRWMERQLEALTHPDDSDLVVSLSDVGILDGKGDFCELLAGELRRSGLEATELRDFYRTVAEGSPWIYVFDEPLSENNYLPTSYRMPLPGDEIASVSRQPGLYAVYYFDAPTTPGGDFRCW